MTTTHPHLLNARRRLLRGCGHLWADRDGTDGAPLLSLQGKLLYCHPPPGTDPVLFQHQHQRLLEARTNAVEMKMQPGGKKTAKQIENVVDKTFFHQVSFQVFLCLRFQWLIVHPEMYTQDDCITPAPIPDPTVSVPRL